MLHRIVLRIQRVHQRAAWVGLVGVLTTGHEAVPHVHVVCVADRRVSFASLLLVVDEVVVGEAQGRRLEIALLPV